VKWPFEKDGSWAKKKKKKQRDRWSDHAKFGKDELERGGEAVTGHLANILGKDFEVPDRGRLKENRQLTKKSGDSNVESREGRNRGTQLGCAGSP